MASLDSQDCRSEMYKVELNFPGMRPCGRLSNKTLPRTPLPQMGREDMGHHHSRDGYETLKIPEKYRPLLRRLQRSQFTPDELRWLLRTHRDLPAIVAAVIREKLTELKIEQK
jgi:hypothetical protein